ncbi:uncharacterized protein J4E87_003968 [Alternaria ethzedia]|uniref:uncharacterized protein n=1 Tax=Alternaria ethzedia TaxID=181014 RepID=UPI0020C3F697|nr:uncharacterized protein J4E87_003968 [Alternaria ethzedia]XP_051325725.1 uncharacterized protein J4E85_005996 [Alternaria conjuncta]KAI4627405.1 hypothetical protein J4E87_003968 [Alternaria ethzedia]KAI4927485.1 hypothetical protein J4E85_005996 [Alternaria conjuncta]
MDNTSENIQKRSETNPTTLFSQPGSVPSDTPIPGESRVMGSEFCSGLTAPAGQQVPGGLFGGSSTCDWTGGRAASQVAAAQATGQPIPGGLFGALSNRNLFGGYTEPPPPSSTNARPLFGFGSSSHSKPDTGGGLFGNLGQASTSRKGSLFGHGATVDSESARADQQMLRVPDIRVVEDQAINFGCDLLTIHVGQDERARTFSIHSDLLTARSTYFKDFFSNDADQKSFDLPEINPRAFALYFQLIYTGRIPSKRNDASDAEHDEYALLCKLYTIAHLVKDAKAKDSALDAILVKATESAEIPSSEHVWIVYAGTEGPCKARKMMVDFYTYKATGEWMRAQGEDAHGRGFPPEFWSELAISLVDKRSLPDRRMAGMDANEYHGQ